MQRQRKANEPYFIPKIASIGDTTKIEQQVAEVLFACGTSWAPFNRILKIYKESVGSDPLGFHYIEYGHLNEEDAGHAVMVAGTIHSVMTLIGYFANEGEDNLLTYKILAPTAANQVQLKINDRLSIK